MPIPPRLRLILYALPVFPAGLMNFAIMSYLLKYATDRLLVPAAVTGLLFATGRIWDAINDPLIGHYNDVIRTKYNKRAIFILVGAPVTVAGFVAAFMPVSSNIQVYMLAAGLFAFFTGLTFIGVPHYSWGYELAASETNPVSERNRIFGWRAISENLGTFAGVGFMAWMQQSESDGWHVPLFVSGLLCLILVILPLIPLLSRSSGGNHPGPAGLFAGIRKLAEDRYARRVYLAGFCSQAASQSLLAGFPFFIPYVLGISTESALYVGIFLLALIGTIPVWIRFRNHIVPESVWVRVQLVLASAFLLLLLIPAQGSLALLLWCVSAGAFAAGPLILNPVVVGNLVGGHGNEGLVYSVFTFVNKSAMALAAGMTGIIISWFGYSAGNKISDSAQWGIRLVTSVIPAFLFFLSAISLIRIRK